jgi:hypothetical protein
MGTYGIFQGCFTKYLWDIDLWDFYGMIAMNHSQYAQTGGGMFTCLLCVWHWCCCGCRFMAPKKWNGTWNRGTLALVGLQDWFRYGAYIGFFNPMGSFGFLFAVVLNGEFRVFDGQILILWIGPQFSVVKSQFFCWVNQQVAGKNSK